MGERAVWLEEGVGCPGRHGQHQELTGAWSNGEQIPLWLWLANPWAQNVASGVLRFSLQVRAPSEVSKGSESKMIITNWF